jgi:tol-pal system protein YbgF
VQGRYKFQVSKTKNTVYCLLFAVCFFLSACASTVDLDLLKDDVSKLQSESLLIKNELNSLKEKASGAATEESFNVVRQSQAEMQSLLSNVSRDIQVLSGRFDENKYFTEKTLKNSVIETDLIKAQITSMEGQIKDIKDRLTALENQVQQQKELIKEKPREAEKKIEEQGKELPQQEVFPSQKSGSKNKKAIYDAAYNAFEKGQYKEAREKFEAFIKDFPQDELTDNAQFWIAETYYREEDFENAILAYEEVLKKYPKSKKVPGALLKQGFAFIELGDSKTGKVILKKLMESYPGSKQAELAKKKIEEIDKKTSKKSKKKK